MLKVILSLLIFSSLISPQDSTFEWIYHQFPGIASADQDDHGGFILAGKILFKTDSVGLIQWQDGPRTFTSRTTILVRHSPDQSYVYGYTKSPENSGRVIKFSYDGNIIWEKNLGDFKLTNFTINNSGEILASAEYSTTLKLINYSPSGDTLWTRQLTIQPQVFGTGVPDVVRNDSIIFVSAYKKLFRLSSNGDLVWEKSFANGFFDISLSDSNIYACFSTTFRKLDFQGNEVWAIGHTGRKSEYIPSTGNLIVVGGPVALISGNGQIIKSVFLNYPQENVTITNDGILLTDILEGARLIKMDFNLFFRGLSIVKPNRPYPLMAGTNVKLEYRAINVSSPVLLESSTDQGLTWELISSSLHPDSSAFIFPIPVLMTESYLLRLSSPERISLTSHTSISHGTGYDTINVNNITMWIGNNGDGSHSPVTGQSGFYWPDKNKTAIFQEGLFFAGKVNGQVRLNGNNHRQGVVPGAILSNGMPDDPYKIKYSIWKLMHGWQNLPDGPEKERYQMIYDNWPVDMGAPFTDVNGDGIYTSGVDEPGIGDESLFYVANDVDSTYSNYLYGTPPLGLEFQTTIFGFDQDNPLKDVVFKKYIIVNKSSSSIEDMYLAYWADPDLGNAIDDYAGVDSAHSLAYCYNKTNYDDVYGTPPPTVGHRIIQGPIILGDASDSALFKGKWIRGYRNLRAAAFIPFFSPSNYPAFWDPPYYTGALQFYNYLQGYHSDGSVIINPVTGNPTKFVVSGNPLSQTGWYEGEGWPGGPNAGDRRYIISTGPFNMAPGDTQEIVIVIAAALGNDNKHSIEALKSVTVAAESYYKTQFSTLTGIDNSQDIPVVYSLSQNYPNPFNNATVINFSIPRKTLVTLSVYDITGQKVASLLNNEMEGGQHKIYFDKPGLASGIYFYRLTADDKTFIKKMMLLK